MQSLDLAALHATIKAVEHGALGSGISGSGPTIFTLSTNEETARNLGTVISSEFEKFRLNSDVFVSRINPLGATVLDHD